MQSTADALATGLDHHRAGRTASAARAYRSVLAREPDQGNALYLYGVLLSGTDEAAAEALLVRAVKVRPGDAESRQALANVYHRAGRPAEAMALWRNVLAIDPGHVGAAANVAGCLREAGDWRGAVAICQAALHSNPTVAALWVGLAVSLLAGGADRPALIAADAALELDDGLARAWFARGSALSRQRDWQAAVPALRRAVALDAGCAKSELNLGNALMSLDVLDEAEVHLRRAILLDPTLPEAYTSLGFLDASRHRLDAAVVCHDHALTLRPDFAEAHGNRAAVLLLSGDYPRGFAAYEWRKRNPRYAAGCWQSDLPQWQGEDIAGRTILVFCEQGFGDTIMCARFVPLLARRGARIILVCDAALASLLARLPSVVAIVPRGAPLCGVLVTAGATVPAHDVWIDQMSLPLVLGITPETIPGTTGYLEASIEDIDVWRGRLPAGRRVGLAWAGNPDHSNDQRRSMQFVDLKPLIEADEFCFVSLQCGAAGRQAGLWDATRYLNDFAQTAACIACLDLVIAVDTAVAHLAGALGVPCWLLLPHTPEWRWLLHRADSPWYASMRLFRQQNPGDWAGVIDAVANALQSLGESSSPLPC